MDYGQQLKDWDEWIRSGQASKVRSLCHQLNHKKIPRSFIVDYAQIARRVGAPELIVLWLGSIVRSEKILAVPATEKEKAIYGLGLLRLGAFREAEQILSEINPESDPNVYFYRASLNINQWNYSKAVPDLKRYIRHPNVLPYSRLVGRLNLCAALITHTNLEQTELQFSQLMRKLKRLNFPLLVGNLLEIRSQWLFDQNRFEEALKDLTEASDLLKKADERSLLYIEKWRLIIKLKASANKNPTLLQIDDIKNRATRLKNWETLRDCDFHRAVIMNDQNLILKVFWGSKSKAYKKRIYEMFDSTIFLNTFLWSSSNSQNSGPVIDLVSIAPTRSLQKLFFILSRDMYQPLRITEIIDSLYPDQYYHPVAGPAKLHRLIARARQWLKKNNYPIAISAFRNAYQLTFTADCQLKLSSELAPFEGIKLPTITKNDFFKANEWAKELNISARTARQQILNLIKENKIESIGHGPKTRYRMKKTKVETLSNKNVA